MDEEQRVVVDEVRAVLGPLFVGLLVRCHAAALAALAEIASLPSTSPSMVDRWTKGGSSTA